MKSTLKLVCLALLALISAGVARASDLTFTSGGAISGPGGQMVISNNGSISITTSGGDTFNITVPSVVKGGQPYWSFNDISDKKLVVDAAKKQTTFTGMITDPALPAPIPVDFSISLTPDDKARITLHYGCSDNITKYLGIAAIFFYSQREPLLGNSVAVNGMDFPIAPGPKTTNWVLLSTNDSVRNASFFSNDPYRALTANVVTGASETVSDENLTGWQSVGLRVTPLNNLAVVDVDLPSKVKPLSPETYGAVDYYAAEHIHLPQYGLSRNLIQNPSFEENLQYWNFGVWGHIPASSIADYYVVDTTQAHSGKKCLKILGEPGVRPAPFSTFAIPVNNGKQYTLSFWAKADHPDMNLGSDVDPGGSGGSGFIFWGTPVTQEWKRYSNTFNAPGPCMSVQFGLGSPAVASAIYVDDVQLEEGPMTDFTRKPVELGLMTDHRDNIFAPGAPIDARWQLSGAPGSSGKVVIAVQNFMGVTVQQHTATYHLGPDGTGVVAEPWLEHTGPGIVLQQATATTSDDFSVREFGRVTIAAPADSTVKHHTLFALGGTSSDSGSWDRIAAHYQYFGIGSAVNFDPPPHGHLAALIKHHIVDVSSIADSGSKFGTIDIHKGWTGPDSDLATIEQMSYERAKEYPEINYWKIDNEPDSGLTTDVAAMRGLIRALTAVKAGILRAHPSAHIMSPDPFNLAPDSGTALADNYFTNGGASVSDTAAIHPYRTRPEEPDMDPDLAAYEAMLKKHNYAGDIWFTEGMGNPNINNVQLGVNVHVALSNEFGTSPAWWGIGNLSYDIGDGERYAAAYSVRSWLVGLKYGNRVKQQVDWYYQTGVIDYDCTPAVRSVTLNTLSDILGNADYVKDVPLSDDDRCYLFKDLQDRPVAVVWSHDIQHETESLPPSTLHLRSLASSLQIFAMDGSRITPDAAGNIPITPYPTYLRGAPVTGMKLASAIAGGYQTTNEGAIVGYAQLADGGHVGMDIRSTLAKDKSGTLTVSEANQPARVIPVSLSAGKTLQTLAPFTTVAGGINTGEGAIGWKADGTTKSQTFPVHIESILCPSVSGALPMDGNLASWKSAGANVFAVPQHMKSFTPLTPNPKIASDIAWKGPADLSATFAIAYTPGMLYLGFDITDDKLVPAASADMAWMGDGVQMYFDPWNLGHTLSSSSNAYDDQQELDVWPNAPNATVYRSAKPYINVAFTKLGVVPAIQSTLTVRPGGYVIQLAIPEAELAPLNIKPGGVFNFAFIVNDNDGEYRKRGLTLTPDGTEPFQHPELYPSVVFGPAH